MSEREIASILKVSHMSINRIMRHLADFNFINFITVGKAHLWKVNQKSYAYRILSALVAEISTINDPLEDLKQVLLKGLPEKLIKRVVLFGSVAKGTEKVNSDIDVFILVKDKPSAARLEPSIEKLSNVCFELYGNRLAPYILTEKELKHKKNLRIIPEVDSGIQIYYKKDK
jgi:predicted nucleotidyltransferase